METSRTIESPSQTPVSTSREWSILWPWPHIAFLIVMAAAGYSFYRLTLAPANVESGYSAIAYSPSTGEYGSSSRCGSIGEAERMALSHCKQTDARIVVWSHDAWCALAVGHDHAFGVGSGRTSAEAERAALLHCREHSSTACRIAVAVSSKGAEAEPAEPTEGTYAAIAYSRSTGVFGSARDCVSLAEAERIALSGCNETDAKIVTWAHNAAWCALAVAEDKAYGYAWALSKAEAERLALNHCREYTHTPYHIAVVVYASGTKVDSDVLAAGHDGALHSIRLSQFPAIGRKMVSKRSDSMFASINADVPGKGEILRNVDVTNDNEITFQVLENGDNRPLKYRAMYNRVTTKTDGKDTPVSYLGQSVLYEWTGDRYKLTDEGGMITPKDLKTLDDNANRPDLESVLAPNKPVRTGESWSIDVSKLAKSFGCDRHRSQSVYRL